MKTAINIEFGTEELERFVTNVGVKSLLSLLTGIDPNIAMAAFQQGVQLVQQQHAHTHHRHRVPPPGFFVAADPFGPPPRPGQGGPPPPAPQGPYAQGHAPQPIREEPVVHERCFPIEETRNHEAGIGCCQCATYNNVARTECRHCGHKFCVITPAPGPQPQIP